MQPLESCRIKHLELIQDVITRMASESAQMKRYAMVAIGVVASVSAAAESPQLTTLGVAFAGLFWFLDSNYLRQERWFRALYDEVRNGDGPTDFLLTPSQAIRDRFSLSASMLGWSTVVMYGVLALASIVLGLALNASKPV